MSQNNQNRVEQAVIEALRSKKKTRKAITR
jgi:hypothetical protein